MNRLGWFLVVASIAAMAVALNDIDTENKTVGVDAASSKSISAADAVTNNDEIWPDFLENNGSDSFAIPPSKAEGDIVSQWMHSAMDKSQNERDAADEALVKSPREVVLPALHNFVVNGSTDQRQLAINALRILALKQGDEDGEIQNMLRLTSYDGDDALAGEAQLALEDIENAATAIR